MRTGPRHGGPLAAAIALLVLLAAPAAMSTSAQQDDLPMVGTIHAGSCEAPDALPAAGSADMRVRSDVSDAVNLHVGSGSIEVPTDALVEAPHAVLVTFGGDVDAMVACGDIGSAADGDDIAIGLRERNRSKVTGIAWLQRGESATRLTVFAGAGLTQSKFADPDEAAATGPDPAEPTLRVNFQDVARIDLPATSAPAVPVYAFAGLTAARLDNVSASADAIGQSALGPAVPAETEAFVGLKEMGGSGWSGILWSRPEGDSTFVTAFLAEGLAQPAELEPPSFDPVAPAAPAAERPALVPPADDPPAAAPPAEDTPVMAPPAETAPVMVPPAGERSPAETAPVMVPPAGDQPAAAVPQPAQGGSSYDSARFGYSVSWGPEWQMMGTVSEDAGGEMFALTNGESFVKYEALSTDKTVSWMIAAYFGSLERSENLTSIRPMLDADGTPMIDASGRDITATWVLAFPSGDVVARVRAIDLDPGRSLLGITHVVDAGAFEAELPAVEALDAALVLP